MPMPIHIVISKDLKADATVGFSRCVSKKKIHWPDDNTPSTYNDSDISVNDYEDRDAEMCKKKS